MGASKKHPSLLLDLVSLSYPLYPNARRAWRISAISHPSLRRILYQRTKELEWLPQPRRLPRDWNNWTFTHDSHPYTWTLCDIPRCIELQTSTSPTNLSPPVIARFTYGKVGTNVLAGGEVGQLSIWRDALSESMEGREVVVVGCLVVIKYFDGLGRVYRNDGGAGSGAAALINAKGKEGTRVKSRFLLF